MSVGSATFQHSRFVGDVELEMNNNVGRINANQNAYVNIGSIGFQNTRVNGDTDIYTRNRVPGGVDAGQGSTVMIGTFQSNYEDAAFTPPSPQWGVSGIGVSTDIPNHTFSSKRKKGDRIRMFSIDS